MRGALGSGKFEFSFKSRKLRAHSFENFRSPLHIANEGQDGHVLLQGHLGYAFEAGDQRIQLCLNQAPTPEPAAEAQMTLM